MGGGQGPPVDGNESEAAPRVNPFSGFTGLTGGASSAPAERHVSFQPANNLTTKPNGQPSFSLGSVTSNGPPASTNSNSNRPALSFSMPNLPTPTLPTAPSPPSVWGGRAPINHLHSNAGGGGGGGEWLAVDPMDYLAMAIPSRMISCLLLSPASGACYSPTSIIQALFHLPPQLLPLLLVSLPQS